VELREKMSGLNTSAQENISGNKVVKAFTREEYECKKFDEKNKEYKEANLKANLLWLKFYPYIDVLSQSLSVAVLLVGGIFIINGQLSLGEFAAFNALCWTLTNPMRMIGMLLNDLQRFFASASKIIELYYSRSMITNRHNAVFTDKKLKGDIEFKNVYVTKNSKDILKNINFSIKAGDTIAIMGETGSGKTSLVSLLSRFSDVTSGEITIYGIPVKEYDVKSLRKSIGIATQDVFLFSDSIDSNICYGDSNMSTEEVKHFAKIADVDFAEKMPDGFDTVIGERGTGLSGGQKQRIALARAVAIKPSILILDDTTSAVDLETEKYIQNELNNLDFECTKIIVAQRISTTKRADKIIILNNGEISEFGTHSELLALRGYYYEVYALQNGINE
ncbi:MAG: ABC transporter ATP-binding protein, partial [Oscillospiraceae bacterium]